MKPLHRIAALHTTIFKPKIAAAAAHPEERRWQLLFLFAGTKQ
jgi:hypothetical protein